MNEKKIFIKNFQSQYYTYLEILSWYRAEIGWFFEEGKNAIHTVPFILTTAAALESSLNDYIVDHYIKIYGNHGKSLIPGLLSMTLKGKLLNIVPLLTSNKFIINTEHKVYQLLAELIKLRNMLVHNKSDYDIHKAFIREDNEGEMFIDIPDELKKQIEGKIDPTFGIKNDVGKYHDALEKMHTSFFDVYQNDNFKGNDLIIELNRDKSDSIQIISENEA
jgi:hypothetical protein